MYTLYNIETKELINSTLVCKYNDLDWSWSRNFRYYLDDNTSSFKACFIAASIMMQRISTKHTWKTIELSDKYWIKLR